MGLNKREIAVIAQTNRNNYSIEIRPADGDLWQAAIKIIRPEKYYEVFTSRGDLKTWHNLAAAIAFMQEVCEDCEHVTIDISKWKFARII